MTTSAPPSAPTLISGAGGVPGYDTPLARQPCCVCPPTCDDDDTGDTCIDAACGFCLHGCPAGLGRPCRIDEPSDLLTPLDPGGTEPLFPVDAAVAPASASRSTR